MPWLISLLLAQKGVMIQQRFTRERGRGSEVEVVIWEIYCMRPRMWNMDMIKAYLSLEDYPSECSPRVVMVTEFHMGNKPKVLAAEPYVAWLFSRWSHYHYRKCISLRGVLTWIKSLILNP